MSGIGSVGGFSDAPEISKYTKNIDIDISQINSIFSTHLQEKNRTTFSESFQELSLDDKKSAQGKNFLAGLQNNKYDIYDENNVLIATGLATDLNLSSEQYDALACVALALASQETGMGNEKGYVGENVSLWGTIRRGGKAFLNMFDMGDGSCSSGLTQIKINDFIKDYQNDESKSKYIALFEKYNIKPNNLFSSNIFEDPAKSAIVTMIVLSNTLSDYDDYVRALQSGYNNNPQDKNDHEEVRLRLDGSLSDEECVQKGLNIIGSIKNVYEALSPNEQEKLRLTLKNWVSSYDGSLDDENYKNIDAKDNKERQYNEERQLKNLNAMLNDFGIEIQQSDLDYIRFALTDESQIMTPVEFCAFAWNNGTNASAMKADRLISAKIGTIFSNPEDYNYDQFAVNVENLTEKYAQQSGCDVYSLNYILSSLALNDISF